MNELTIMGKTLRYLLIALAMASFLSGNAQSFATQSGIQMAGDIVVSSPEQVISSGLQSRSVRSITPVAVKSTRKTVMGSSTGSSASSIFTTTSRLKGGRGMSGGGFSGGASAGGLMSSGSNYAATTGTYTTGSTLGTYSSTNTYSPTITSGPRREEDWEDDVPNEDENPYTTPVGDAIWPLMLCALAYAFYKVRVRRHALD